MKKIMAAAILATSLTACGGGEKSTTPIVFETTQGKIIVELNDELAPITSQNFRKLVRAKFYDGLTFHRYVPGFVIQGGDPLGTGTGGADEQLQLEIPCQDGETVVGEITNCKVALSHSEGVIAMARSASPNSASSQFYFTLAPQPSLDGKYAVFGKVTEGLNIVKKLRKGDVMNKVYESDN